MTICTLISLISYDYIRQSTFKDYNEDQINFLMYIIAGRLFLTVR